MKKLINEEFKRMQLLAGLITESQLNEAVDTKYFTMDGTKSEDLKKDFTLKSTYDPGMTMICPKDLDDKSDRADGMLGYIFSLNTLKDKELYPLRENHPDYGKMIVMSQSTKEDLSNLIKKLGGIQIDVRAKKQEPTSESTDIEKSVNEALRKFRKSKLEENFLGDIVKKLKRLFTGEKMKFISNPNNDENSVYGYYQDDEGKKWIGVRRSDLRYEPGYRKSWVAIYDLKDEEKIKKAEANAASGNKQSMSSVEDPFAGGDDQGGYMKGDYYPEPVKVINNETF